MKPQCNIYIHSHSDTCTCYNCLSSWELSLSLSLYPQPAITLEALKFAALIKSSSPPLDESQVKWTRVNNKYVKYNNLPSISVTSINVNISTHKVIFFN